MPSVASLVVNPVGFLETGIVYCDDNLHRLSQFPAECIDLIYLDPPFFSNRQYEVIWGDEAEVRSFEDRWEGGIYVYVNWMKERVMEMHRILKPTGSIYLHCDWHASHYLKQMLDDVFGESHFHNEIIWHYTGGGRSKSYFSRKHDTIFWYWKGNTATFNVDEVRVPYKETSGYAKSGITSKAGKKYMPNPDGTPVDDVWDIPIINPMSKERLGYPTQKPEALLERIVRSSSSEGDIILDPFAGCGTALVAAQRLRRQWVGIDISPTAVGLMKRRMEKVGATVVKLIGMPVTVDQLKALKPFEFQNWVIQRFNGTHSPRKSGDMGIDGFSFLEHLPIQVKQSEGVGRNVVDNFETAVERDGKHKGYIVAFSFTRGAHEEAARVKAAKGMEIELITVESLLTDDTDLVTPIPGQLIADIPLPKAADPSARPSAADLIASELGEVHSRDADDVSLWPEGEGDLEDESQRIFAQYATALGGVSAVVDDTVALAESWDYDCSPELALDLLRTWVGSGVLIEMDHHKIRDELKAYLFEVLIEDDDDDDAPQEGV